VIISTISKPLLLGMCGIDFLFRFVF